MGTLIVTGGAGFIGCNFVRHALARTQDRVVVLDKLTYAGNLASLADVSGHPRYAFVEADIADRGAVRALVREVRPSAIVNFAAETHVDRSIDDPAAFVQTNLVGTFELLEAARQHVSGLAAPEGAAFRFLHVSTDEVYGTLGESGQFSEDTPYAPNSPYAASKAGADHLVRAWHETYGLPVIITNCSNNYGPYQFPEKLIPLMILNALEGKPLPIYGDGGNVRDWLYVEDHCRGILLALQKGRPGGKYNIGGGNERKNIELVDALCAALERERPAARNPALLAKGIGSYAELRVFVKDRPGHDRRYAIDATRIRRELDWRPEHDFEGGLARTVRWYLENAAWCEAVQAGKYRRERLGLERAAGDRAVETPEADSVRQREALSRERDEAARARSRLDAESGRLRAELAQRGAELAALRLELAALAESGARTAAQLRARLDALLGSRVWRWTRPLRSLLDWLSGA